MWHISIEGCRDALNIALWIRAFARIPVKTGGTIPGPLIPALTDSSIDTRPSNGGGLVESWTEWWHRLIQEPTITPTRSLMLDPEFPPFGRFGPPKFDGLTAWPALQQLVLRRQADAIKWNTQHYKGNVGASIANRLDYAKVVSDLEYDAGHMSRPFSIYIIIIPVDDPVIRRVRQDRFLVPIVIHNGERWESQLRGIVSEFI
jgi:hypothetical protein